ncbi:MAG: hypothetical protein RIS35_208 [Pseudomonadota bacterium]
MNGRRRLLIAAGLAAAGLAGCANPARIPPPAAAPLPPSVRIGDRWRYAKINLYNGETLAKQEMRVTALEPLLRIEVTDGNGAGLPPETYVRAWDVVQENVWEQIQVFGTPCPLLPRRLEPGSVEDWRGIYQVPGDSWRYTSSVRIEAHDWERVEAPAGVFDALRVSRRIAFVHQDFRRVGCQRLETLWYAPQVNRWVRREVDGSCVVPGRPPMRVREDRVAWVLLEHLPASR